MHNFVVCCSVGFILLTNLCCSDSVTMNTRNSSGVICHCTNCPGNEDQENLTCILKEGAQCYAGVELQYNPDTKGYEEVHTAGCFPPEEQSLLQCKGDLVPHASMRSVKCCNFTDLCNKNLILSTKSTPSVTPPDLSIDITFFVRGGVVLLMAFLLIYAFYLFLRRCKRRDGSRKFKTELYDVKVQKHNHKIRDFKNSSGSGAGKSLLVKRTIGREVKEEFLIGKGRFSEKWVVRRNGELIVRKTFSTLAEERWKREEYIYSIGIFHQNVLGFIGSDILSNGLRAIFFHYHEFGSLYDYLKERLLSDVELLTLARSASCGLLYLHLEIRGTNTRHAIVHRNLTSKNFLVNNRRECIISNFEVAILENETDKRSDFKVTSPRYAAPEIINESISYPTFEALKMADIYAFGLILWEMCRRSITISEDYALPFSNVLPEYPTVEDMKDLFASKNSIHDILGVPSSWEKDKILKTAISSVRECISENNEARLPILTIKKRFDVLGKENETKMKN